MVFTVLSEQEYTAFLKNAQHNNFSQSLATKNIRTALGDTVHLVGLLHNGRIIAASLLIESAGFLGYKRFYAPRGFLFDPSVTGVVEHFVKGIKAYLKKHKALYFRMDPPLIVERVDHKGETSQDLAMLELCETLKALGFEHFGYSTGYGEEQPRWNYVLPLVDKTYEQVWKAYKPRTRNRINAAKNFGSKVREGGIADLPEFYDILTHTSERNEFASRNIGYFQAFLEETLEKGLSKLLFVDVDLAAVEASLIKERTQAETRLAKALTRTDTAGVIKDLEGKIASANKSLEELVVTRETYGNQIVSAASIFITYGKEVLYFHSGGYEDLMRFAGQYFLQDYMIQTAMQQGYETYNFLGIQAVDESDGVYTFKRGFSGEAIAYLGQFDLVVAPKVYGLYQVLRKLKNRG